MKETETMRAAKVDAHAARLNELRVRAAIAIAGGRWPRDIPELNPDPSYIDQQAAAYVCDEAKALVAAMDSRGWVP